MSTDTLTDADLDRLDALRAAVRVAFPWRAVRGEIESADGAYPCSSGDDEDPEHAYVVAIVNAHEALVAEVRRLRGTAAVPTPTLPPIGSRWGNLTDEQRAALPVGTHVEWDDDGEVAVCCKVADENRPWLCIRGFGEGHRFASISDLNVIVSYPAEVP